MKKLKLKLKELTNPTILTHHEIKNIFGGGGSGTYTCTYYRVTGGAVQWTCPSSLDDCQWAADLKCDHRR